jgi:hypothetical protein
MGSPLGILVFDRRTKFNVGEFNDHSSIEHVVEVFDNVDQRDDFMTFHALLAALDPEHQAVWRFINLKTVNVR